MGSGGEGAVFDQVLPEVASVLKWKKECSRDIPAMLAGVELAANSYSLLVSRARGRSEAEGLAVVEAERVGHGIAGLWRASPPMHLM